MVRRVVLSIVLLVPAFDAVARQALACPFCAAQSQTFTEEFASMHVVALTRLVSGPPAAKKDAKPGKLSGEDVPKAVFEITKVLKGKSLVGDLKRISTLYFGKAKPGQSFLIMGVDPPKIMWTTPLALTGRGEKYLARLGAVPTEGANRLRFFQSHLEDEDEMLARDAYDEFAKAPYDWVIALKAEMDHEQLIQWIKDENVPASRRRLYLTMLGVCGTSEDLPLLERFLKSKDRRKKAGLDAMIACYLTLRGAQGMPLIEELFLKNKKAEYADTYAAIMAIRFHGTQSKLIPRKRLLVGLRYMLDRPQLADLVIPDLAKWEDWSQMARLVSLFKDADEKSSWVRVPVINYLRACPLPKSKEHIKELEKVDPAAVKRARTFFPFGVDKKDPKAS